MYNPPLKYRFFTSIEFIFITGCILSLTIPWFVNVTPSISDSYYYGFSNKTATLILLSAISLCFFLLLRKKVSLHYDYFDSYKFSLNDKTEHRLNYRLFYFASAIILIGFLYALYKLKMGITYGESAYHVRRLYLMQDGLRPYVDFEYAYGSALLYLPYLLTVIFKLSVPVSYELSFFFEAFIGYYSLWLICKRISKSEHSNKLFLLLFIPTYVLLFMAGVNYTMFRFATPLFLIIAAIDRITAESTVIKNTLYSIAVFILIFIISPELSITSTLVLFVAYRLSNPFTLKSVLMIVPAMIFLVFISFSVRYIRKSFTTLLAFAQGGNNFPWMPSFTMLIFFFFIFLSMAIVFKLKNRNNVFNKAHLSALLFSLFNLPGAMGRCDAGHLLIYGIGFFILTLSAAPYFGIKLRKATYLSYYVLIFVFVICGTAYQYKSAWLTGVMNKLNEKSPVSASVSAEDLKFSFTKNNAGDSIIDSLLSGLQNKPLLLKSYARIYEDRSLRRKTDLPYFIDGLNMLSPSSVDTLVNEIIVHDITIVPKSTASLCGFEPMSDWSMFFLLGLPPVSESRNNPAEINARICQTLDQYYFPDYSVTSNYFTVYRKKKASTSRG
jgi:hypothetical protein